jgi:class 3 adenylate cyclase
MNRRIGMPNVKYEFVPLPAGGTALVGRLKMLGLPQEYLELPFEFSAPHYFLVERFYSKGLFKYLKVGTQLQEVAGGPTRATLYMEFVPRWFFLPVSGALAGKLRQFAAQFRAVARRLSARQGAATSLPGFEPLDAETEAKKAPEIRRKVQELRERWAPLTTDLEIPGRLAQYVFQAPEPLARRMRPAELARAMRRPLDDVLRFCLHATRAGYLDMTWNVLCPGCKGSKLRSTTLGGLESTVHCESCNIDYGAAFDRNVEVTFSPSAKVRTLTAEEFCFGSPSNIGHFYAQIPLAAGERRRVPFKLPRGRYRWRSISASDDLPFMVDPDAPEAVESPLVINGNLRWGKVDAESGAVLGSFTVEAENHLDAPTVLRLERLKEREDAVTAHDLTTLQDFRELFGSDVLRPGVELSVSNVALLFTDLKDSTAMYERQGDGPAFNLVQDHFDVMFKVLQARRGALVKTIGDAVMAAFTSPTAAVTAALDVLQAFEAWNSEHPPDRRIWVKIGIHQGPCIAITQNGRLDYFGSTVNRAARIQGAAGSQELVVSEAVFFEPEVQKALKTLTGGVRVEKFRAELKGVDGRMHLFRVTLGGFQAQVSA